MNYPSFDLVFVTTGSCAELFEKYLQSISQNTSLKLLVVLIAQNGIKIDLAVRENTVVKLICSEKRIGLSVARNLGINWLTEVGIDFSYVMFPDDDSTFDKSFFERFKETLSLENNYLIDVKNLGESGLYIEHNFVNGAVVTSNDWNNACSVNMIICKSTFLSVGMFDERLGVGSLYGAGEDSDYFIRSCNVGASFNFTNQLYSFHPSSKNKYLGLSTKQLITRFNNYGKGVVFFLVKHSMHLDAAVVCFRGLGGVAISVLRGQFKLSLAYFYSFITRFSLLMSLLFSVKKR